jgi:predicted unusual protein kinase regulating ubiquinone biosynthesis (AarF/ABC1/UbiB family)
VTAVPQGRVRRTARTARVLGPALVRPGDPAVDRLVDALGELKGAAMKVGQLLAVAELGVLSDAQRARLRVLYDAAPAVGWPEVERVLVRQWGAPVARVLQEVDPMPVAAASLGQVHRAVLPDGRRVAVKVQYPGVADAVRADLSNTGLLLRLARIVAPGSDPRTLAAGLRAAVLAELDYEREAIWQRRFAAVYDGHPWLHVPWVDGQRSTREVLVSEWAPGRRYAELVEKGPKARGRFGEVIARFALGGPWRSGIFNADPHPGNWRFRKDGRVTVLDFGSCAAVPAGAGGAPVAWRPRDAVAAVSTDEARRVAGSMRALGTSTGAVLLARLELSVVSTLAELGAQRNWAAILDEYRTGRPPGSDLGVEDRAFWFARGRAQLGGGPSQPPVAPL